MLGSMYSAVSGLSAHQTKMNVIGNNIANVNTYGFKASRVTFSDVFYQTMSSASAPTTTGGGTNPTQLGYGAKVSSVDVLNTRAGSATTDRALDVYINGDGYLPTKNADGVIKYTRVGVLSFDLNGNLVDRNGNQVLGFKLDPTTKNPQLSAAGTTTTANLVAIKVLPADMDKYTGISIGQNGEITAIQAGDPAFTPAANTGWMASTPTVTPTSLYSGAVKMSVNRTVTIPAGGHPVVVSSNTNMTNVGTGPMQLAWDSNASPATWTLTTDVGGTPHTYTAAYTAGATSVTFNITGGGTITVPVGTGGYAGNTTAVPIVSTVSGTSYDVTATTVDKSGTTVNLSDTWTGATDTNLTLGNITIPLNVTAFQTALNGGFTNVEIGNVGAGPGVPVKIAQIANAKFINPNALSEDGAGYYVQTTNSGDAVATVPGNGGTGTFRAGALEMSNVDLSREFTEMIITQRGFQANTKMITTSDELLSELVAMKR